MADRLAAMVRGPERLREDIADEIADHLASHAEENEQAGYEQPWVEAEQAFGDPKQVARELRRVHLGDLIMFQRILAICLIVVAAAAAATAYFSWSSMTAMSERMEGTTQAMATVTEQMHEMSRETANKLTSIDEHLGSLSRDDSVMGMPSIKLFLYEGSQDHPSINHQVRVISRTDSEFKRNYYTNREGRIDTGPLAPGVYQLEYSGRNADAWGGEFGYTASVHLMPDTRMEEIPIDVSPAREDRLVLDFPEEITWDWDRIKRFSLSARGEVELDHVHPLFTEHTYRYYFGEIPTASRNALVMRGFLPGQARLELRPETDDSERLMSCTFAPFAVPEEGGDIQVSPHSDPVWYARGRILSFEDAAPIADMSLTLLENSAVREVLKTDAHGAFGTFFYQSDIAEHFKDDEAKLTLSCQTTDDRGRSTMFEWPVVDACDITDNGPRCDINLSQWAGLHLVFGDFKDGGQNMNLDPARYYPRLVLRVPPHGLRSKRGLRPGQPLKPLEAGWDMHSRVLAIDSKVIQEIRLEDWKETNEIILYIKPGTYELTCEFLRGSSTSDHFYYLPEVVLEPGESYEVSIAPPARDSDSPSETAPAEPVSSAAR